MRFSGRIVASLLLVTAVFTAPALAKKTSVPVLTYFPRINGSGGLATSNVFVVTVAKINLKNGKGRLKADANVPNYAYRSVKFKNLSGVHFLLPAQAKCNYDVTKVGAASLDAKL